MKAVIWDLDGTLIDSSAYHWEAWQTVMTSENFNLNYEDFVADFGKRNDEILRGRLGADFPESEISRLSLLKEEHYRQMIARRGLTLSPGALYWLARLKKDGWKQALGTSAPRGNIDAVFSVLDVEQYFQVVMSSEEVSRGKPAPDLFLAAAKELEVDPLHCIVIEDAPAGVEAARRAGMQSVGVLSTHDELESDWVFQRLDQIPENFFQMRAADAP